MSGLILLAVLAASTHLVSTPPPTYISLPAYPGSVYSVSETSSGWVLMRQGGIGPPAVYSPVPPPQAWAARGTWPCHSAGPIIIRLRSFAGSAHRQAQEEQVL